MTIQFRARNSPSCQPYSTPVEGASKVFFFKYKSDVDVKLLVTAERFTRFTQALNLIGKLQPDLLSQKYKIKRKIIMIINHIGNICEGERHTDSEHFILFRVLQMASGQLSRSDALACSGCKHACHVMLYSTTKSQLFRRIPIRHIILVRRKLLMFKFLYICLRNELFFFFSPFICK